jgi:hypothetical protein
MIHRRLYQRAAVGPYEPGQIPATATKIVGGSRKLCESTGEFS